MISLGSLGRMSVALVVWATLASFALAPDRISAAVLPVVVVYPLTATGGLGDPGAGGRFATIMAGRIASGGGVTVEPFTPGTDRAHFLSAAREQGADYYVTGFLTPIGDEVTVVSQIVSVAFGTVMWSHSASVKTFADADVQADEVRQAILDREGRYLAQLDAPPAAPQSTTRPEGKANEAQIALTGRRRGRGAKPSALAPVAATGTSVPAPVAAVSAPAPTVGAVTTLAPVATPLTTPQPPSSAAADPPPPSPTRATSPPAFGRGSGFARLLPRLAHARIASSIADRFRPTGGYLVSLTGDAAPVLRATAIAELVRRLHTHDASSAPWRVGRESGSAMLERAESLCASHAGIGTLYAARLRVAGASTVTASVTIVAANCRGDVLGQASGIILDARADRASRAAAGAAAVRLRRRLPATVRSAPRGA